MFSVYAVLAALVRFFLTTTGFWLFRIALARRRAACGNKLKQIMLLKAVKNKTRDKIVAIRQTAVLTTFGTLLSSLIN